MSRFIPGAFAFSVAIVTISIALWPAGARYAQEVGKTREKSPGRVRKNLGEYPANVEGFEKVRVVEDTVQPGAGWTTRSMPVPMFCTLLKGEFKRTLVGGETRILKAGDSWVCEVGQSTVVENTGSEPAVMRMHLLIPPGQK